MVRGGFAPAGATTGALPLWIPCQGPCPWTPRRAFGPLDSQAGIPAQGSTLAGVTARDGRAATRNLPRDYVRHNNHTLHPAGRRRFPKGDRRALWSPPQRRNPRAAGPSRAVTPARDPTRCKTPVWVSRGPKALRGVSKGAAPLWRESRGQRPLVGFQRAKPFGPVTPPGTPCSSVRRRRRGRGRR